MLLRLVLALDRARALPLPRLDHRAMGQALRVHPHQLVWDVECCVTWSWKSSHAAELSWAPFSMRSSGEGSGDCLMGSPCVCAGNVVARAGPDSSMVVVPGAAERTLAVGTPLIGEESDSR